MRSRSGEQHDRRRSPPRPAGAKAAEWDKRLDAAALTLIVTIKERDALERRAGAAIKAMLADGLTLAEVVTWIDGETHLKEVTRLADFPAEEHRS